MILELTPGKTDTFLTIDAVFQKGIEVARSTFVQNGILPPTFLAVSAEGKASCYVIQWTTEGGEGEAYEALKVLFRKDEIVRFSYFGEAWIVQTNLLNDDGSRKDIERLEVKDDHRKQTCLQIVAADHYGENRGCAILTRRKEDGQVLLGEVRHYDDNAAGGPFTKILDSAPRVLN